MKTSAQVVIEDLMSMSRTSGKSESARMPGEAEGEVTDGEVGKQKANKAPGGDMKGELKGGPDGKAFSQVQAPDPIGKFPSGGSPEEYEAEVARYTNMGLGMDSAKLQALYKISGKGK